jgi:hypothetical protein
MPKSSSTRKQCYLKWNYQHFLRRRPLAHKYPPPKTITIIIILGSPFHSPVESSNIYIPNGDRFQTRVGDSCTARLDSDTDCFGSLARIGSYSTLATERKNPMGLVTEASVGKSVGMALNPSAMDEVPVGMDGRLIKPSL